MIGTPAPQANINQCGGSQWRSALHYAASGGHKETVRVLVRHGADLELKDGEWNTAANLCTQSDVLQLLSKEVRGEGCVESVFEEHLFRI